MERTSTHGISPRPARIVDDAPRPPMKGAPLERPAMVPGPKLATLALDDRGQIRDCCSSTERLFGYSRDDLLDRHVSDLLPGLADTSLTEGGHVNPRLAFLSRCWNFDAMRRDGGRFPCWLFFNRLNNPDRPPLVVLIRTVEELVRSRSASA